MSTRLELVTSRPGHFPTQGSHALRPAVPDDAPRLVAMFERCSPAARYGRFLAPLQHFPASHLVDVVRSSPLRRSWVVDDLDSGDVIGVASWFRKGDEAEVGLLVEDGRQRTGLGTALLDALATSARAEGVTSFVAHTLADARHVHRMLRRIGSTAIARSGHTCTLHISLVDEVESLAG